MKVRQAFCRSRPRGKSRAPYVAASPAWSLCILAMAHRDPWEFTIRVLDVYGKTLREFFMIWADLETSIRRAKHLYKVWCSPERRGWRVEIRDTENRLVFYKEDGVEFFNQ